MFMLSCWREVDVDGVDDFVCYCCICYGDLVGVDVVDVDVCYWVELYVGDFGIDWVEWWIDE